MTMQPLFLFNDILYHTQMSHYIMVKMCATIGIGDIVEVFILASGSKGNMAYVKNEGISFFVDAGISYQKIASKMKAYQEEISDVKTLFLTHEHHDHIYGLKSLLKQGSIVEVFLTKGTYDALASEVKQLLPQTTIIKADEPFRFNQFMVHPIMLSHDAKEPVGFIFEEYGKRFVVLTDTGYVDQSYIEILKNADLYLLEANHDPKKLLNSARPFSLKQRILGVLGHLSNEDAASLMNQLITSDKKIWIVAHISEDCNDIYDIEKAIVDHFDDPNKVEVIYSSQNSLSGIKL